MVRTFDDHLMRAHTGHMVVQSFSFAIEQSLHSQGGELVRNHAQIPLGSAIVAIGQNLRRRLVFLTWAEWADSIRFRQLADTSEVAGTPGPVRRNNYPTA